MHPWQNLILARVETLTGATRETKLTRAVKQFLYDIGTPHFIEPHIAVWTAGQVHMTWKRSTKWLLVVFDPDQGLVGYSLGDTAYEGDASTVLDSEPNKTAAAVRWLMADTLGVAKDQPKPFKPAPPPPDLERALRETARVGGKVVAFKPDAARFSTETLATAEPMSREALEKLRGEAVLAGRVTGTPAPATVTPFATAGFGKQGL